MDKYINQLLYKLATKKYDVCILHLRGYNLEKQCYTNNYTITIKKNGKTISKTHPSGKRGIVMELMGWLNKEEK